MAMPGKDNLETFIRRNRDKFGDQDPPATHMDNFWSKLNHRVRDIISIVPYLIRVAAGTIIIFTASIIIWNNYIRKDRNEISLKNKISLVINRIISH